MVKFPGLGLELEISNIAISILGIDIYWYAIFIVLAIILSLLILKHMCRGEQCSPDLKFENILELTIYMLPIAFIFARLYYVVFNLNYYSTNPIQIFNIKSGGLAIFGGIIGGAITAYIYCKLKKINFTELLDKLVPVLALSQTIGRWGNFFNIEAYGTETNNFLRMGIIENGIYKEVHPTFLYESIADFIIFIILIIMTKKKVKTSKITLTYLLLYSFTRFFVEGLRTDSLMLFNVRISQVLSLIIFVICCSILCYQVIKTRKNI